MKLLTVKEVAKILNLSEKTLYQWKWQGRDFPFLKVGRCLRVNEQDLFYFIQKSKSRKVKKEINHEYL